MNAQDPVLADSFRLLQELQRTVLQPLLTRRRQLRGGATLSECQNACLASRNGRDRLACYHTCKVDEEDRVWCQACQDECKQSFTRPAELQACHNSCATAKSQARLQKGMTMLQQLVRKVAQIVKQTVKRPKDAALAAMNRQLRRVSLWFRHHLPKLLTNSKQNMMDHTRGWWAFVKRHAARPVVAVKAEYTKIREKQTRAMKTRWNKMVAGLEWK